MRFARVKWNDQIFYAQVEGDKLYPVEGDLFGTHTVSKEAIPAAEAKLLCAVQPTKVVCVGKNYTDHIAEMVKRGIANTEALAALPERPELFLKPPSALNDPDGEIVYPKDAKLVDYEGEIGIVIGKKARYVKKEDAAEYVFGLTLVNDVSRRDRPKSETQWTNGKCYDTFCPVGPYITTDTGFENIQIQTVLNGEIKQNSTSDFMLFKVPDLIAFFSSRMTLMPGDIIASGTPSGVGPIHPGDVVTIRSDNLGELTCKVVEEVLPD